MSDALDELLARARRDTIRAETRLAVLMDLKYAMGQVLAKGEAAELRIEAGFDKTEILLKVRMDDLHRLPAAASHSEVVEQAAMVSPSQGEATPDPDDAPAPDQDVATPPADIVTGPFLDHERQVVAEMMEAGDGATAIAKKLSRSAEGVGAVMGKIRAAARRADEAGPLASIEPAPNPMPGPQPAAPACSDWMDGPGTGPVAPDQSSPAPLPLDAGAPALSHD